MSFPALLVVSGLCGYLALSYELVWYRVVSFASASRAVAFGLLLAFYLLGLALGSLAGGLWCRQWVGPEELRPFSRVALSVALANGVGFLVVPGFAWFATVGEWRYALPLVTIAAGCLGAALPLLTFLGVAPDERAGARFARVYLANIIGSAAGSLLTGYLLCDRWPVRTLAVWLLWLGAGLASVILAAARRHGLPVGAALTWTVAMAAALTAAAPWCYGQLYEKLLYKRDFTPGVRFAQVIENRQGVIAVAQNLTVYGNGAYDSVVSTGLRPDRNQIIRAYALAALHPRPREILEVGLGTGSWAQVLVHHPDCRRLTLVEINPGYRHLVATHAEVASVLGNPKVDLVIDDGRQWLLRHPERRFDAIVMNTTFHWRVKTSQLLSWEFLTLVRSRLAPAGIFYCNTTGSAAAVRTALAVFPFAMRVGSFIAVSDSPMSFDRTRWRQILSSYAIDGRTVFDPDDPKDRASLEDVVRYGDVEGRASLATRTASEEIITDDNMLGEWPR